MRCFATRNLPVSLLVGAQPSPRPGYIPRMNGCGSYGLSVSTLLEHEKTNTNNHKLSNRALIGECILFLYILLVVRVYERHPCCTSML